ncbi:MAG: hypoxanthine phosphoribosyltransferase [Eubacteriaceae bacterium]|nr:hypoxanthine phosphoribosyltransferase [Eubacteriaceae bacterium]
MIDEMKDDIKKVLYSQQQISERLEQLGEKLTADYAGKNPLVLCVLKGGSVFMADIVRSMKVQLQMDFMAVSSYSGTATTGEVRVVKDLESSIEGREILIVEDIVDTGLTLSYLIQQLSSRKPASINICALLLKKKTDPSEQRHVDVKYVGFECPDEFVVGYGLDYNEKYRNLPYIGVLKEEVYA